jgi:hypothetical protein
VARCLIRILDMFIPLLRSAMLLESTPFFAAGVLSIFPPLYLSVSLPLSLSLYIYIYMYECVFIDACVYVGIELEGVAAPVHCCVCILDFCPEPGKHVGQPPIFLDSDDEDYAEEVKDEDYLWEKGVKDPQQLRLAINKTIDYILWCVLSTCKV